MYSIIHNNREIPVSGPMAELVVQSHLLSNWLGTVSPEVFTITKIEVQSADFIRGAIRFAKLMITLSHEGGVDSQFITYLRGDAVVILPVFIFESKKYVPLVKQARLPAGTELYELIAGMLDGDVDPRAVALREIEEESELASTAHITIDDIKPLFDGKRVLSSPGGLDEGVYIFYVEKELTDRKVFEKLEGLQAGLVEENESTTTTFVPLEDVAKYCVDAKTLATLYLYEHRQ